jgi:small subunit ribosomal protein S6
MPLYEHVFIARQDISSQQVEGLVETFKTLVEENGGKVGRTEYWGIRNLAYRMKKNRKGHYVLMDLDASAATVAEMERQEGLHEDVLRFLTTKVEQHEEGPSAVLQNKGGRDRDRGDRGDRDRGDRGDRDRGDRGDRDRGDRDRRDRRPRDEAPAAGAA